MSVYSEGWDALHGDLWNRVWKLYWIRAKALFILLTLNFNLIPVLLSGKLEVGSGILV